MLVKLPLIGTGTPNDPYRCTMPTYTMIDVDYAAKTCIVDVLDADIPADVRTAAVVTAMVDGVPNVVTLLPAGARTRWHSHLDSRYQERSGQFRPVPTA